MSAPAPRPKYQVFISSTFSDLQAIRREVTFEVLKARHIPAGMETFPAANDRGWEIIQRTIEESDYYVLLIAGLYGSVDEATGLSWTEKEYDHAISKGIPVLAFIRAEDTIVSTQMEKEEPKRQKLAAFVKKVEANHLRKKWQDVDDLKSQVAHALRDAIDDDDDFERSRPGWYRRSTDLSPDVANELARLSGENARLLKENTDLNGRLGKQKAVNVRLEMGMSIWNSAFTPMGPEGVNVAVRESYLPKFTLLVSNEGKDECEGLRLKIRLEGTDVKSPPGQEWLNLGGFHHITTEVGWIGAGQTAEIMDVILDPRRGESPIVHWYGCSVEGVLVSGSCPLTLGSQGGWIKTGG